MQARGLVQVWLAWARLCGCVVVGVWCAAVAFPSFILLVLVCDGVPTYLATRTRVPLRSSMIPMLVLHQRKRWGEDENSCCGCGGDLPVPVLEDFAVAPLLFLVEGLILCCSFASVVVVRAL